LIHQPLDDDLLFGAGKNWGPAVASVLQAVKQLEGIKTEGVLQIPPQTSVDVKAGRRSQDVSSSKRRCCWPF